MYTLTKIQWVDVPIGSEVVRHGFDAAELQGVIPHLIREATQFQGARTDAMNSKAVEQFISTWDSTILALEGYADADGEPLEGTLPAEYKPLVPVMHKILAVAAAVTAGVQTEVPEGESGPTSGDSSGPAASAARA